MDGVHTGGAPGRIARSDGGAPATVGTADAAVSRALGWLRDAQLPSGELPAHVSPLVGPERDWSPDPLKFITALCVLALDPVPGEPARSVVDRAVAFLHRERETMAQWRYWAESNDRHGFTPPDADDTACCSMAVATRGHRTARNRAVLLANRDAEGRFHTWLVPRRGVADPRAWWAMRDELRRPVRELRRELWASTEAWPDDVDGVVNLNVARYLGARTPAPVVRWLVEVLRRGEEATCDSWHRNPFTFYAGLADAAGRGVRGLDGVGPVVVGRVLERTASGGDPGPPLDAAMALLATERFGGPRLVSDRLADSLRDRQLDDGSWEHSVFFYGGPTEVVGWASAALSTATAVHALQRSRAGGADG